MSEYEYLNAKTRLQDLVKRAVEQGEGLTPNERVTLLGVARNMLGVPATIWSPEDFLGWGDDDYIDEMWETFDVEVTEAEWDQVAQHAARFTEGLEGVEDD